MALKERTIVLDPTKLPKSAKNLYPGCYIGYLKLLKRVRSNPKDSSMVRKKWRVQCMAFGCGKEFTIPQSYLVRRPTPKTDCGCINVNNRPISAKYPREYRIWTMMNVRCTNPAHVAFQHYGGRGIQVCSAWQTTHKRDEFTGDHSGFIEWFKYLGPAPTPTHTLDRIDVDGNYEPGNIKWSTPKEQALNTRKQKYALMAAERRKINRQLKPATGT